MSELEAPENEISFLLGLLFREKKLPQWAKEVMTARIKLINSVAIYQPFPYSVQPHPTRNAQQPQQPQSIPQAKGASLPMQSPSTLAAMARHAADNPNDPKVPYVPPQEPHVPEVVVPVKDIAKTPEAAAAMQTRNALISAAISGKPVVLTKKGEILPNVPKIGR